MKKLILLILLSVKLVNAETPFCTDSALAYLKKLVVDIGPRPMGSVAERRALEFAVSKFKEFGLDDAYITEMKRASSRISINTNSGIAVGILKGKSNRTIVIGGHIDSAFPDVPGAIDDGSGSACVIELARILSKEKHESTLIFCLFGGEEYGMCGSNYFVSSYPWIDSCVLMFQIDMANGSDPFTFLVQSKNGNAPLWLAKAAYQELSKLNYGHFDYLTHFFTFLKITPTGGVGSDHLPFLNRNIPAICFSSSIDDNIHTPQDDFKHFKSSGLKRTGDLIYSLVLRFDNGVPYKGNESYYLIELFGYPLFVVDWFKYTIVVVAIIVGLLALIKKKKANIETLKSQRPSLLTLKVILLSILIQVFAWLPETVVGLLKGIRYPWIAYPSGYILLGFLWGVTGAIISIGAASKLNLSKDPYRWFLRAFIISSIFIILLLLLDVDLALYPSTALLLMSLSMLSKKPVLKYIFWLASPYLMIRLFFSEGFFFIERSLVFQAPIMPQWVSVVILVLYILTSAIWFLPFLTGFCAVYFDSGANILKPLRKKVALSVSLSASIMFLIILTVLPSYSDEWRQMISIEQNVDLNKNQVDIYLRSKEYLKDLKLNIDGMDTIVSCWCNEIKLESFTFEQTPWIQVEHECESYKDSTKTYFLKTKIKMKYRPYRLVIKYSSTGSPLKEVNGPYVSEIRGREVIMHWETFPDTFLVVPISLKINDKDTLLENIKADFVELIKPVSVQKELSSIRTLTIFEKTRRIDY